MKKNIFKILFIIGVQLTAVSCKDAIDIVQDGEMNKGLAFQTVDDLNGFLTSSVYSNLSNFNQIGFTSLFTDEVGVGSNNSALSAGVHQYYLDISDGYSNAIWLGDYRTINRANRLLTYSAQVTPSAGDRARYNSILAETRAVRAWQYIDLLSYFSTDMKNPEALGVILQTDIATNADQKPRSKNSEIFKLIEDDLNYAEANIVDRTGADAYFYISKNAVNAIKARYYAYRGDYVNAKLYAQRAISNAGISLVQAKPIQPDPANPIAIGSAAWNTWFYGTTPTNPLRQMYSDFNRGEVIFGYSRPAIGSYEAIGTIFATNGSLVTGAVQYDMGRNLFNILNSKAGDLRRYAYIDPTSLIDPNYATSPSYRTTDVLVIDKYPGKYNNSFPTRNDIKLFRLSEMYLILAEAAANSGDLSGVADNIKIIEDARNYNGPTTKPTYSNVADAWGAILDERRLELAYEGHRYIDLKRLGKLGNRSIQRDPTDDNDKNTPVTLSIDDYRFTLPIPLAEWQGNPGIQQNPGYRNAK